MKMPERVNAEWVSSLSDKHLEEAAATLHAVFEKEDNAERKRAGEEYRMLRGPESLISAWMRWLMVTNEQAERRTPLHRRHRD
jgi:hypothetical protein